MHGILAKYKEADPFRQPVDVEAFGIPDYYDVIKKPMDLKTAREKVRAAAACLHGGAQHCTRVGCSTRKPALHAACIHCSPSARLMPAFFPFLLLQAVASIT
jgi:hypothetical protein